MKFRKRMKPVIKKIGERTYEAVDWYHSKESAEKKAEEYKEQGFFSEAVYEPWWAGWFVYVSASEKTLNVPYWKSKQSFYCSEASAQMFLDYYGYKLDQDYINRRADRFAVLLPFLNKYVEAIELIPNKSLIINSINNKNPVILSIHNKYLHTIVIIGYTANDFIVHDSDQKANMYIDQDKLLGISEKIILKREKMVSNKGNERKRWTSIISNKTGLTGIEAGHVYDYLVKKDVDPAVVDFKTIGEDVADFADKYDAVWNKLIEHGIIIERPIPVSEIRRKEELWKEEEEEWLLGTKEGVKELLRRIYKNGLTKKEEDRLKEKLLNRPELATLIALYDDEEQEYAKRFLAEMVIAPTRKDVKELLKADTIKIRSERGWIKSIDDVPVKALRSIDLAKTLLEEGFKHVAGEREDGTVAIYSKKPVVEEIVPKKAVVVPKVEVDVPKIEELATRYSYADILKMAHDHEIKAGPKVKMIFELLEKGVIFK